MGLDLLSRHPLPGVVAGGQRPGSVGCRVLALLAGELAVWSILLPPVVRLRLRKTFNNEEEKFKKNVFFLNLGSGLAQKLDSPPPDRAFSSPA